MKRVLVSIVGLWSLACTGLLEPTPVDFDGRYCGYDLPFAMGSFDSRMEGVIAEWGNNATGPFGIVEFIPNEDRSVVSMSSMAMGQIGDETQIGDLEYGEWGGHHGVVINMLGDHNDIAIQRRFLLIDLPAGIVIFQSWAEKSNWNEQIETVLGIETSIRFQDPIPVLPYSEQAPSTLATSDLHTARGAAKLTTNAPARAEQAH